MLWHEACGLPKRQNGGPFGDAHNRAQKRTSQENRYWNSESLKGDPRYAGLLDDAVVRDGLADELGWSDH
jgi:hypothetical protein